jgi:hypothetical protein
MAEMKVTDDTLIDLRGQGLSLVEIARRVGLNNRTVQRRFQRLNRQLTIPPLSTPVPPGFEVTKLATRLDKDGNPVGQNVQAKPVPNEAPIDELVPAGHLIKGLSSYVVDGEVRGQWIKTRIDQQQAALAQTAALEAMKFEIVPYALVAPPAVSALDLLSLYTLTDCHVGMLAWSPETAGEPWDLGIAEFVLLSVFSKMVASAPASAIGVLNQLGDFLHFDSLSALTPTSGHVLDADSRYQKVVQVAVKILVRCIGMLLQKHDHVHVFMHEGNHDPAGSVWLRVMFAELFRDNPRVKVELSPNPYQALQHGKTMLAFHHGHLARKPGLPILFAAQYAEMWGATDFRYAHTGHLHNEEQTEHPGIKLLQHPTLASPDAYAARNGWLSKRQAMRIDYSNKKGEIGRAIFIPEA